MTVKATSVFKTDAINHSAIFPHLKLYLNFFLKQKILTKYTLYKKKIICKEASSKKKSDFCEANILFYKQNKTILK